MGFLKRIINRNLLFGCLSGLAFLVVFWVGYRNIPDRYYQNRDDALITFSHAKNLAEYGIVGVNPSGGRVEGYSTPIQFFLFYAVYKAARVSYADFTQWQTYICAFLLGFFFIKFFMSYPIWGMAFSLVAAVLCVRDPSFLEWHGSGMENPIVHVMFLISIYILYKMILEKRLNYSSAIILFAASIARVESIYYLGPLILLFAFYWHRNEKNAKGMTLAAIVFTLWGSFHLFRYLYFGDLLPNPAYAHSISVLNRVQSILTLQPAALKPSFRLMASLFTAHHGYLMILALPLLFFMKKDKENRFLILLLAGFVFLACLNPFFFGPSSLDTSRTTTHMTILVVLFGSYMIFHLRRKKLRPVILPIFFIAALAMTEVQGRKPYELNWSADDFGFFRSEIIDLQQKHDLFRPTVGNTDLGLISWHKDFNIIDLGRIGDPVISRLRHPRLIADYIFDFAAPDILEIHEAWACAYSYLFKDPRFREMYEPAKEERTEWLRINCAQEEQVKTGLWVRKDIMVNRGSRERRLIDSLKNSISVQKIREELARCAADAHDSSSLYVTRSAYRYLPEFAKKGDMDALRSLFKNRESSKYDLAMINGGNRARWYRDILSVIQDHSRRKIQEAIQKSGRIDIKEFPYKTGFYEDEIWTRAEAMLDDIGYQVPPAKKFLAVRTYGFRPASMRSKELLRLRVFADGTELELFQTDSVEFVFQIPEAIKDVRRIRIISAAFVPKKIGLNDDKRKLGADIQAVEFR